MRSTRVRAKYFFYISDDGDILAIRMDDWKLVLMEQRAKQLACWAEPFVPLRMPKMFNLRRDPFERGDEELQHLLGLGHLSCVPHYMQAVVAEQIEAFKAFAARGSGVVQP